MTTRDCTRAHKRKKKKKKKKTQQQQQANKRKNPVYIKFNNTTNFHYSTNK